MRNRPCSSTPSACFAWVSALVLPDALVEAGVAARSLQGKGRTRAAVELGPRASFAGAVVEGLVMGAYRFDQFKDTAQPANTEEAAAPAAGKLDTVTLTSPAECTG